MFVLNWKRHFHVPNIFYTDTDFKSTRKGKFFFLSDFVFKLIHNFCFKNVLYNYIDHLFDRRLVESCLNVSSVLFNPKTYLKDRSFSFFLSPFYTKTHQLFKKLNFKIKFLLHFSYLNSLLMNLKSIFTNLQKKKIFVLLFFFKKKAKQFKLSLMSYILKSFYNYFFFFKKVNFLHYSNNNFLFILYQTKFLKRVFNKRFFYFSNKHSFITFFIKYLKNVFSGSNLKKRELKGYSYFFYKCKFKKLNLHLEKAFSFYLYYNNFLKNFHNTLYYYFFLKKVIHLKYDNILNFVNFNNLKLKKELIITFKNKFLLFKKKIKHSRFRHRKKFYFFLNSMLDKRHWLIGPINRIKMFKFTTYILNRINASFANLKLRNSPFYENKLSFFYNAVQIRESFFLFLGKGRYREEFLLLKNKK